jgi:2-dehydro-3-deoxyglucarate aldolase/4-hydroxy-2-oxoheptanedioate aldolase
MEFREKITKKAALPGMIVTMNQPCVSEMLSKCGFDWLWIDMEHAPLSLREVQELVQAKNETCAALVRVPANTEEWIKRVLDLGVEGIIIPHVNTVEEAKNAVGASYYPPDGYRGVGMARASQYGMDVSYRQKANGKSLLFVQIEHKEGVENVQEIVQVPGIDGIIVGPYDLSGSYGKLGQVWDPEIVEGIKRVLDTCKQYGKPVGIFAKHSEDAKKYLAQGFQLIAVGVDMHYLWSAAKASIDATFS